MIVLRVEHKRLPLSGIQRTINNWWKLPAPQAEGIKILRHEVCACKDITQFKIWWKRKGLQRMLINDYDGEPEDDYVVVELETTILKNKTGIKQVVINRRKSTIIKTHSIPDFIKANYNVRKKKSKLLISNDLG